MRPHQNALLLAVVVSLLGMAIGPLGTLLLPLRLLNTHLHELGHAIVALLTGGQVAQIVVRADGSGETPVLGGILPFVASAGYLGAAAAGAGIVLAMRTEAGARRALGITGGALAVSLVLFVRGEFTGILSGLAWSALLILASIKLRGSWLLFVAGLVGVQQGINALRSLAELLQISATSETHSDALLMENATRIPAVVWSALWGLCGLALVGFTARRVWGPLPAGPSRPV